jgi:hypothetical protein
MYMAAQAWSINYRAGVVPNKARDLYTMIPGDYAYMRNDPSYNDKPGGSAQGQNVIYAGLNITDGTTIFLGHGSKDYYSEEKLRVLLFLAYWVKFGKDPNKALIKFETQRRLKVWK